MGEVPVLNLSNSVGSWRGERLGLSKAELNTLLTLTDVPIRVRSFRDVYNSYRPDGFIAGTGEEGYRANVRTMIKRLRYKFRSVEKGWDGIESVSGRGYLWRYSNIEVQRPRDEQNFPDIPPESWWATVKRLGLGPAFAAGMIISGLRREHSQATAEQIMGYVAQLRGMDEGGHEVWVKLMRELTLNEKRLIGL